MSLEIKFCPTCNNLLNITKDPPKNKQVAGPVVNLETPNTVSADDDQQSDDDNIDVDVGVDVVDAISDSTKIEQLINKLANNENIVESELGDFKLEQFVKHKTYQKLEKKIKQSVQIKLTTFFEKLEDATSAYYHCRTCSYAKPIDAGMLVASRMGSGSTNMYMNMDKLKNRVYNSINAYTRNYICTNKNCVSHNDHSKREAVMFRIGGSVQIWYTCCACSSSWKGE